MVEKSDKQRVATIIVTYNRQQMLGECLRALLKQTRLPDAILIVDNCSVDRTADLLLEAGLIAEKPKEIIGQNQRVENALQINGQEIKVIYLRLSKNCGGAGGFHIGLEMMYKDGFDWFWLMDDDVQMKPEALETLLTFSSISKCIQPSKESPNGEEIYWEGWLDLKFGSISRTADLSFHNGKKFTFVNYGCFEGMLIHRDIVEKIGFPDERFFIVGDDLVYGLQASFYTNVIYVSQRLVIKKNFAQELSDFAIYYYFRNRFLVFEYLKKFANFSRLAYLFHAGNAFYFALVSLKNLQFRRCFRVIKGFFHGMFGKYY